MYSKDMMVSIVRQGSRFSDIPGFQILQDGYDALLQEDELFQWPRSGLEQYGDNDIQQYIMWYIENLRKWQAGVLQEQIHRVRILARTAVMNRPPGVLVVRKEGNCWYTTLGGNECKVPNQGMRS